MLILFNHATPAGLARALPEHGVVTAQERGWKRLSNGALLNAAEAAGFDLLLTAGKRIRYQQNLAGREIAILVLTGSAKWSRIREHFERIVAAVRGAAPGSRAGVGIPFRLRR